MTSTYQFYGVHYIANYLQCNREALMNIDILRETIAYAIQQSGATILQQNEKIFENNGYTILFLLSESHCSVHTYPEHTSIFMDLFTCGENCSYKLFEQIMFEYLQPKSKSTNIIYRSNRNIIE
jgi:S-adenosylmethionine decarboxylase proenzyme